MTRHELIVYLFHKFFKGYSLNLFFAFGALLLYSKTESILWVLIFGLAGKAATICVKIFLASPFLKVVRLLGVKRSMVVGMFFVALMNIGIFYLPIGYEYFYFVFIILGIIHSLGNMLYYIPSHTITFGVIGTSDRPGRLSSAFAIIVVFSGGLAAATGLFMSGPDHFLKLFIIAGFSLLMSSFALNFIKLDANIPNTTVSRYIRKISKKAFFANFAVPHILRTTALPLIILFTFTSIETSIWISGLTAFGAVAASYFAGRTKDQHRSWLIVLFSVVTVVMWVLYGVASTPVHFIGIGLVMGMANAMVYTARDARLGREVTNSGSPLEAVMAFELARHVGVATAYVLMIGIFALAGSLPQWILMLGALFALPRMWYAIGDIENKQEVAK